MNAYADAATLLRDLQARGAHLERRGEKLRCVAPPGVLTEQLRRALAENKTALLELLAAPASGEEQAAGRAETSPPPTSGPASDSAGCPKCGATPEELVAVRARRALAAAFGRWDAHAHTCNARCVPHQTERCPEGERLAGAYFDAWTRWLVATGEEKVARG